MDMLEMAEKTKAGLERLTGLKAVSVVGLVPDGGEHWTVNLEMLEKKSIPDGMDILGTYEVKIDAQGNVLDFSRTGLRRRADVTAGS